METREGDERTLTYLRAAAKHSFTLPRHDRVSCKGKRITAITGACAVSEP